MPDKQMEQFGSRVKRISQTHRKLSDGYVTTVNHDGLIVAVPRRRRLRVPFAGIALVLIGIVAFKGIVHFELGAAGYDARVAQLAAGSTVERVGAWIMQADPLTLWVSEQARNLVQ